MVADNNPPEHAIIKSTGAQFNYVDGKWIFGFVDTVSEIKESDYSAFEVLATDEDIVAGTVIGDVPQFAEDITDGEVLAAKVRETIPACKGEHFVIKSSHDKNEIDVVVDWGEGTIEQLS
jgi:hypothetical protein